ncbi:MAG: SO_0444 family Cu/Zn efflux transporter [Desulfoprunum sp.]|nr:SO_0444 family Cu/Zn efflux transporter [Desulfoprunum sp.]
MPAATSLQKQGANKGATTAFLISTPESGVDSIFITYALLDPIMTVARPVAAFITAIAAGFLENILHWPKDTGAITVDRSCPVDKCCDGIDCPDEEHRNHHGRWEKLVAGLRFAVTEVWGDIALWFFVGLLLASLITVIIPDDLMASWLGGGISSMLLMLLIGIPLYICATASTPIAAALILKGVSPGAALVFLLVGPATNITSLAVLVGMLGRWGTFRYLLVLSVSTLAFGLGIDQLYLMLHISPRAVIGEAAELIPESLKYVGAIILLALSVKPLFSWFRRKRITPSATHFQSGFPTLPKAKPAAGNRKPCPPACGCGHE